jgi:hypothetical protein
LAPLASFVTFQKNNCTISFGLEKIFQKYPKKISVQHKAQVGSKLFNSQNFSLLTVRN